MKKQLAIAVLGILFCTAVASAGGNRYEQTNLVADVAGAARVTDPNLVNPWGIAVAQPTFIWVADNASGVSTLYDGEGNPAAPFGSPLVVIIPPAPGGTIAKPTGIVFNGTGEFPVSEGGSSGSSFFIFATEDGTLSGWTFNVDVTHAILAADNSASGAIYKGLAIASNAQGNFLYATNFHAGTVDVFDSSFAPATLTGSFVDPKLPSGYAPFGIQAIGGELYVTFAEQDADKEDEIAGHGKGVVDVFDTDGTFVRRLADKGTLNAPWGLALAPADFGAFSNDLLVGNFGDGAISAFDPATGKFQGVMRDAKGKKLRIDGLWGLAFGSGTDIGGAANELFFTAGPDDESHGLFGSLTAAGKKNGQK